MIRLNTLLHDEGVDPSIVRLVRHQDTRSPNNPTPYQLWLADDGRLELYQRIQGRLVFGEARFLASFVATPLNETLFVGLYEVGEVGKAVAGLIDPITGEDVSNHYSYDLTLSQKLREYRGRLVIDWGLGFRSWVQRADKRDKLITELRRTVREPEFPGFLDFRSNLKELVSIPSAWRSILSAVSGIYLLVDPETGRQYVGSAQGEGGFWGRWEQYAASGHGGNRRMQDIPAANYQVSVLEVASSSANPLDIAKMESRWKLKLLSRQFGLNAN